MRRPLAIRKFSFAGCQVRIELAEWTPAAALVVFLIWYLAYPSKIAAMGVVALAGLYGAAYAWCMVSVRQVHGQRRLRYTAVQVGDELEEDLQLINNSSLPVLWAQFIDHSNIPEYTVTSVRATTPHNTARWRARVRCTRRGVFALGPWEMLMGDPIGLLRLRKTYTQPVEVLVYPSLAALPESLIPHSGVQGDHRPLHQPVRADTTDATGSRPYLPGDPLRHLHWRTTARKNALYVKQFEPDAAASVWLLTDTEAQVHLGEGSESTFETMILLAASLAARLLQERMGVGLFTGCEAPILPRHGQAELWPVLRALAELQPSHIPLRSLLEQMSSLVGPNQRLVVITPSLDSGWLAAAQHISGVHTQGKVEVLLLDPASFGGAQPASAFLPVLAGAGIPAHRIFKGQIQPLQAVYGELGQWEFKSGATGRAILRRAPHEAAAGREKAGWSRAS